ncbi:MAG: hypothetical protein M3228_04365 [Actinomycetota bacterium]|nr:hypothetical protein [Actinomycetota bacterium]
MQDTVEPEKITFGSELAVVALVGVIRILVVQELPIAEVVTVERQLVEDRPPIDVPVVPLRALQESGLVHNAASAGPSASSGAAAAALAARLLQRAGG